MRAFSRALVAASMLITPAVLITPAAFGDELVIDEGVGLIPHLCRKGKGSHL